MPLVQEYVLQNRKFREAEEQLRTSESDYNTHISVDVPEAASKAVRIADLKTALNASRDALIAEMVRIAPDDFENSIEVRLDTGFNHIENATLFLTDPVQSANDNTPRLLAALANAREQFEAVQHLQSTVTITQEELQNTLGNLPDVIPDSIQLIVEDTDAYLRWAVTGMMMSPIKNRYSWINDGQAVAIAMADTRISVNLHTNQVKLTAHNPTELTNTPYRYGREYHVHPHVLLRNKPCLGDWGGPITEAISEGDWATVSGMLVSFLSSADGADVAGKYWYLGVVKDYYGYGSFNMGQLMFTPNELPEGADHAKFHTDSQNPGKFIRTFYNNAGTIIDPENPPHIFEVGDTVILRETSSHYQANRTSGTNPANVEGKFFEAINILGTTRLRVKWPDGINTYGPDDLEWVEEPTHILPTVLTDLPQSEIAFPTYEDLLDIDLGQVEDRIGSWNPALTPQISNRQLRTAVEVMTERATTRAELSGTVTGRIAGVPSLFS